MSEDERAGRVLCASASQSFASFFAGFVRVKVQGFMICGTNSCVYLFHFASDFSNGLDIRNTFSTIRYLVGPRKARVARSCALKPRQFVALLNAP